MSWSAMATKEFVLYMVTVVNRRAAIARGCCVLTCEEHVTVRSGSIRALVFQTEAVDMMGAHVHRRDVLNKKSGIAEKVHSA